MYREALPEFSLPSYILRFSSHIQKQNAPNQVTAIFKHNVDGTCRTWEETEFRSHTTSMLPPANRNRSLEAKETEN